MKSMNRYFRVALPLLIFLLIAPAFSPSDKPDYEHLWSEIDVLMQRGLPKSAAEKLDLIYHMALTEKNNPQLLKAIIYRFKVLEPTEEEATIAAVDYAKSQLGLLDETGRAILNSVMAELYQTYYNQNRYQLLDRTALETNSEQDMRHWDLPKLQTVTDQTFTASLPAFNRFDTIPAKEYAAILLTPDAEESYNLQPTLFDVLAHRLVDYYLHNDAGLQAPEPNQKTFNESLWLPAADFCLITIEGNSKQLKALRILQQLIRNNLINKQYEAFVYNDLLRLETVKNLMADNTLAESRYLSALVDLQAQAGAYPVMTDVAAKRAEMLVYQQNTHPGDSVYLQNKAKALSICMDAIAAFPDSRGAKSCKILQATILDTQLQVTVQRVETPDNAIPVMVTYKNVTKPAFRILRTTSEALESILKLDRPEAQIEALKKLHPIHAWSLNLPFESDYSEHATIAALPKLKTGLYVLMASSNADFSQPDQIVFTSFQVSNLSFVSHKTNDQNRFFVLDRSSGKGIKDVKANVMMRRYDYQKRTYVTEIKQSLETDKEGAFVVDQSIGLPDNQSFYVELFTENDTLFSDNYFDLYSRKNRERVRERSWFFTDRAIYRPGQQLYFKGITLLAKDHTYEIVANSKTVVELLDVNQQLVSKMELTTNEFGSFEGVFTIPSGKLNGSMRLRNASGSASVQVEEYKRPSFEVAINNPDEQFKLGETIRLEASAMAFAGFGIDSAAYTYTVERQVSFPYWRPWYFVPPMVSERVLIASGESFTHADGSLVLSFVLEADNQINRSGRPLFQYNVNISVTDKQGETQSASLTLNAAYSALLLSADMPEFIEKGNANQYSCRATNLQYEAVKAKVVRHFWRFDKQKVQRKALWAHPDRQLISADSLQLLFPLDNFYEKLNPLERPKTLVYTDTIVLDGNHQLFPANINKWQQGSYVVSMTAFDDFGQEVESVDTFVLFDPQAKQAPAGELFWAMPSTAKAQPGETIHFNMGSSAENCLVQVEVRSGDTLRLVRKFKLDNSQQSISYTVQENDRGRLAFQAVMVRYNRVFKSDEIIDVPFDNRKLSIELISKRDVLTPGAKESWELVIHNAQDQAAIAEMLAGLYDASLDQFAMHNWNFNILPQPVSARSWSSDNGFQTYTTYRSIYPERGFDQPMPVQPPALNLFGFNAYSSYYRGDRLNGVMDKAMPVMSEMAVANDEMEVEEPPVFSKISPESGPLKNVVPVVRTNFNETAFFYPQLLSDAEGRVRISFTLPDALTKWKLMLFAHDKKLHYGQQEYTFSSSRPLMIMGNTARFYYEGDTAWIAARIVNTGKEAITGIAGLEVFDALTMKALPVVLDNAQKPFVKIEPGRSRAIKWKIAPSATTNLIAVRFNASAGIFTDSEQKLLPVLNRKVMLTESLPMQVKAESTKTFVFESMAKNVGETKQLVLNFSSNPVWYAVQALPYINGDKGSNADQLFYRFYANSLASHIANAMPLLMNHIESWKQQSPDAFLSQLQKNEQLKSALLQETPWVMDALNEQQQKERIAILFDLNRMRYEQEQALQQLQRMQLPNGSWPWFEGMPESRYITRVILQGLGQLKQMSVSEDRLSVSGIRDLNKLSRKALGFVQQELAADYTRLREKSQLEKYTLSTEHLAELYAWSFFDAMTVEGDNDDAIRFFLNHCEKDWLSFDPGMQAMTALVLQRSGRRNAAQDIIASLRERAIVNDEQGTYWKQTQGYFWHQAKTENQVLLITAFDEVVGDNSETDAMRSWLLSQKRTNNWSNSRATAEAIYALLLKGSNWTEGNQTVNLTIGEQKIDFAAAEAGTGFIHKNWQAGQIQAEMARLTIENQTNHIVWGGLFRQYLLPADEVVAYQSPLSIRREIFIEKVVEGKVVLVALEKNPLKVGDKLVVRMILAADRDMEFVHVKDQRAATLEPIEQLSGYRFQGTLGFYASSRDATTELFFDYLPKGSFVIESAYFVQQSGHFNNGFATIQCMYAPEFAAHSAGNRLLVRE